MAPVDEGRHLCGFSYQLHTTGCIAELHPPHSPSFTMLDLLLCFAARDKVFPSRCARGYLKGPVDISQTHSRGARQENVLHALLSNGRRMNGQQRGSRAEQECVEQSRTSRAERIQLAAIPISPPFPPPSLSWPSRSSTFLLAFVISTLSTSFDVFSFRLASLDDPCYYKPAYMRLTSATAPAGPRARHRRSLPSNCLAASC